MKEGMDKQGWYSLCSVLLLSSTCTLWVLNFIYNRDLEVVSNRPAYKIGGTVRNITSERANIVIYNRVAKCGSRTLLYIINKLSEINNFTFLHSRLFNKHSLNKKEEALLLNKIKQGMKNSTRTYALYDRHMFYINFTGEPTNYINLVRNPIEREISRYYYVRSEVHYNALKQDGRPTLPPWTRNLTIEEAVLQKKVKDYNMSDGEEIPKGRMVPYFCGQERFCLLHNDRRALQRAMYNIDQAYAVVGILEDLNLSLSAFQRYLPRIFSNLHMLNLTEGMLRINVNSHPKVSQEVKIALYNYFKAEVELYYYITQRLIKQLQGL